VAGEAVRLFANTRGKKIRIAGESVNAHGSVHGRFKYVPPTEDSNMFL